ncbi:hypothetical protein [Kroppenstedtia sanguinis]|uniref:Minor capsid protein n=1 Tax=Kroppenstedtia sanguinis TaxID=1380684 RepID=A0ABW4C4K2_9BACL
MTIDFLERLVSFLDEQGYYAPVISPILGDGRSIAVMVMPNNDYQYYFDGSYRQGYAFQVTTKHDNQLTGYQTLLSITNLLDSIPDIPSGNGSYRFEGLNITTSPNVVAIDDRYYIHAAQFSAALYIEGGK